MLISKYKHHAHFIYIIYIYVTIIDKTKKYSSKYLHIYIISVHAYNPSMGKLHINFILIHIIINLIYQIKTMLLYTKFELLDVFVYLIPHCVFNSPVL